MPRKRPPTADDHLRALRRDAACLASDLARALQHAPAGPIVISIFHAKSVRLFSEINRHQHRYEGRDEDWFRLLRQVRDHAEWGPRLFDSLTPDEPPPATDIAQGSDP